MRHLVMAAVDPQPPDYKLPYAQQSDADSTMLAWTSSPLLMVVLVLLVAILIGLVYIARLRRQSTAMPTTPGYPQPVHEQPPPPGSYGQPNPHFGQPAQYGQQALAYGQQPQQPQYGAPPQQPGHGQPPPGYGGPPSQQQGHVPPGGVPGQGYPPPGYPPQPPPPHYGQPPQQPGYGQPPPPRGYGGPPPASSFDGRHFLSGLFVAGLGCWLLFGYLPAHDPANFTASWGGAADYAARAARGDLLAPGVVTFLRWLGGLMIVAGLLEIATRTFKKGRS